MTGFGASDYKDENISIRVELRSLNSKNSDIKFRMSHNLQEKEMVLRNLVKNVLKRGKIDVNIDINHLGEDDNYELNTDLIERYCEVLKQIQQRDSSFNGDIIQSVLRIPSVIEEKDKIIREEDYPMIEQVVHLALEQLNVFRRTEGTSIELDFQKRVETILELLEKIQDHEDERKAALRKKYTEALNNFSANLQVDKNRFEQEMLYYLEKLDITEEKVRLKQHCHYFVDHLGEEKIEKGKKLNFIVQEMGREINTLGSKANYSEIQRIVVDMKNELEKIKEQTANVV